MSTEDELLALASEREAATDAALQTMELDRPGLLLRQLRAYISRQVDKGKIGRTNEKIPQLKTDRDGVSELICPKLSFSSGTKLDFRIQVKKHRFGWLVKRFQFHVHLPHERRIKMVRIHLNVDASHDPLMTPRCHFHVDDSKAHVPFPIINPRLILHLICEHIEPDFGT